VIDHLQFVVCNHLFWKFNFRKTIIFHKDDYNYREVGASGAVTFVFGDIIATGHDVRHLFIIPMAFGTFTCCILFYGMS
jgi:hypothetical protein